MPRQIVEDVSGFDKKLVNRMKRFSHRMGEIA